MTVLYTFGHGRLPAHELAALLQGAGIQQVVDIRRHPGSRRNPHTNRRALEQRLAVDGVDYRWEAMLGGRREPDPQSPNRGLRDDALRGYADHLATAACRDAVNHLLEDAAARPTAIMCAESDWRRCHRRLVADAVTLLRAVEVRHLGHDGTLDPHRVTAGARVVEPDVLVWDPEGGAQGALFAP